MLKAITASLLMEQVLAPSFKFKPRFEDDKEPNKKGEIKIKGFKLLHFRQITPSFHTHHLIETPQTHYLQNPHQYFYQL